MKALMPIVKLLFIEKKDIWLSVFLGFLAGISAVGLFSASGYMLSKAALEVPLYALMVLIASIKLFGVLRAVSRYGERLFSHRATFTMLSNLRVAFYEKLEPIAPRIFQTYRSGDLLARVVGDVESLQNFFLRVVYPPILAIFIFIATILFTSFYSIYVALILLVGLIMTSFIAPGILAVNQTKVSQHARQNRGLFSTEVTEWFYGFRDLKIHQKIEEKQQKLMGHAHDYVKQQEKQGIQLAFNQSVNAMISFIVTWVVLAVSVYLVSTDQLDGIFLAMMVMLSLTVFENATPMALIPVYYEESKFAAERLTSIPNEEQKPTQKLDTQNQAIAISINNVEYQFPGQKKSILKGINLDLLAGSKTAIVGPSGSGKSTLLQLLMKLSLPSSGQLEFNGIPSEQLEEASFWKEINVVLQKNHFFYGTVRDNLQIAKDNLSDEELTEALRIVKLGHFSLDSQVLEKGENLSGGEKQRLAIARAFLKKSHTWFLDEPTSSIDAITEKHMYDHLFEYAKNDTLVLVSHRLTGLEKMDQIVVMEEGGIVEKGSYEELMEAQGHFYQLKQIEKGVLFS
ncbi:thiol reductant ABC exporter subunit CydC [Bacillus carboniphilus]|uniref:Thiol reductant ABC exporter subunit CydC n=1 Tax=Bacillus carboniphilus TaxID=86663 RepID=A0ABY9JTH4_9BACI|nr:thiol reductant ABC exporter subunit CydC [Bacillus carboniphilus]WLR41803.1 thiol reductant ABC exporter subunit CydC [Bacillus carboniphilus]